MEEPTQVASQQVVEGSGEQNTPPQETVGNPQGTPPPQETPPVQVENGVQPTSSQDGTRPLTPAEHYEIRKLRTQMRDNIAQMQRRQDEFNQSLIQTLQQRFAAPPASRPKTDPNALFSDPDAILDERDKRLIEEFDRRQKELIEGFKKEVPQTVNKTLRESDVERQEQEALELIFPKSSENPDEPFEARRDRDPFRRDAILRIFQKYGLDSLPPKAAAELALDKFDKEYKSKMRSPNAPSKAQMASTATGTPVGGAKPMNPQDINRELQDMNLKAGQNSALMTDPKFKERWDWLTAQASKLLQGVQQ